MATEHHLGDACGEDNAAHFRALWEAVNADLTRERDACRREHDPRKDRARESSARDAAWDDVTSYRAWNAIRVARESDVGALQWLVDTAKGLPDKPTTQQVHELHNAGMVCSRALSRAIGDCPPGLVGELRRLRRALDTEGQRLHRVQGRSDGAFCWCPGCELTRAAYDTRGDHHGYEGHRTAAEVAS